MSSYCLEGFFELFTLEAFVNILDGDNFGVDGL